MLKPNKAYEVLKTEQREI